METQLHIGSDHAGFELKSQLVEWLKDRYAIQDHGTFSDDSTDYPDYGHRVASRINEQNQGELGILICGSGNGISMTANKHEHVRCALCWNKEIAELARLHNDANIVSLPARFISLEEAKEIVDAFLNTNFEGGRHQRRVDKIACM